MAEIEKKWYVLRAISGKEAKVKEYLEADLKNSDLYYCCSNSGYCMDTYHAESG